MSHCDPHFSDIILLLLSLSLSLTVLTGQWTVFPELLQVWLGWVSKSEVLGILERNWTFLTILPLHLPSWIFKLS